MDVRSLECFIAVAEELHFRRAAERLHLTQPSLSQRIRLLEAEVGAPLFKRDRRHVSLTSAGSVFLAPARQAVEQLRHATRLAMLATRGEVGRLRLGFTVIAFYGALPAAVRRFRQRHPAVDVELFEMNSPSLEAALRQGDIDLGVLHPPLGTPGLSIAALHDEPMRLALPASHRLARRSRVRLRDLDGEPFLMAPRSIGPSIHDRVIAQFRDQGFSPRVVQAVAPMTTLVGLVAAGVGLGFVTRSLSAVRRPGVVYRDVTPRPPALPVAAAWHGDTPSATAARFLEIVLER
ncbi:LysR family transcriptional regulator [soil metagenome]